MSVWKIDPSFDTENAVKSSDVTARAVTESLQCGKTKPKLRVAAIKTLNLYLALLCSLLEGLLVAFCAAAACAGLCGALLAQVWHPDPSSYFSLEITPPLQALNTQ